MIKHAPHNDATRNPAALDASNPWSNPFAVAFSTAGAAYFKMCIDWQQEMTRFVGARLVEDQRAQEALASCSSLADVLKAQQDWALAAAKEYAEEAGRLARIATRSLPLDAPIAGQPQQMPEGSRMHAAE